MDQTRDQIIYNDLKEKVFKKLGGFKCVNCGCDEKSILEINHKSGNGSKLLRDMDRQYLTYFRAIIKEKIDISELEVTCRVCNALHYVSKIMNVSGHTVKWKG